MACFLVSAATAVGVTAAKYVVKAVEKKHVKVNEVKENDDASWSKKLNVLEIGLWTGSFVLAGEHILHGEVVPFFPFLTAAADPTSKAEMLHEMSTVGVAMAAVIIVAWGIGLLVAKLVKRAKKAKALKA